MFSGGHVRFWSVENTEIKFRCPERNSLLSVALNEANLLSHNFFQGFYSIHNVITGEDINVRM